MRCSRLYGALCVSMLFAAACGNGSRSATAPSTTATPAPAPGESIAQLAVRIDSLGSAVAVTGLSQVEFDASRSTGTGTLQYAIDFGDNTSSTEALARHVYQAPGTYTPSLTVTDASGRRTSASQTVTVRSVTGSWFAAGVNRSRGHVEVRRLTLTAQDGVRISGEFQEFGHASTRVTGAVENERTLKLNVPGEPEITGNIASQVSGEGATMQLGGFGATDGPLPFQPAGEATADPPTADSSCKSTARVRRTQSTSTAGLRSPRGNRPASRSPTSSSLVMARLRPT